MLLLLLLCSTVIGTEAAGRNSSEAAAKAFLAEYDGEYGRLLNLATVAQWGYDTNISDSNSAAAQAAWLKVDQYRSSSIDVVSQFDQTDFAEETKRQLSKVGQISLSEEEALELSQLIASMGKIYGSTKVCLPDGSCEGLEPGLTNIMAESTDYDLRLQVWKEWRDKVGRANRPHYIRYVELKNKLARINNHTDLGDLWRDKYETETFTEDINEIYKTMQPLYLELHAYIRKRLFHVYGPPHVDLQGTLPAHLLGDMWGRFWNNLFDIAVPFPDKPAVVPSAESMKGLNYTVLKMFQTGDNFYSDLGMYRVPESFWDLSMLEKPEDGREVICHATAWDFYDAKDFRIRMCTRDFSFEDLQTIHHELGHIQYQQKYMHQPQVYRDGANDGFHEAIGELMSLVSSTPSYLSKLGLLVGGAPDDEQDLNFLMSQALTTVSTLPFHLVYDQWRWNIFKGDVPVDKWNAEFWRLKAEIVGVAPAVDRDDNLDLDGTALFHICQDYDMIRYFTRTILQFQFLESLCETSGHDGPLHKCDFSGSKAAGAKLGEMLELGASKPWPDALEKLTGGRKMSSEPILKFFAPLHQWLKETNEREGNIVGWTSGVETYKLNLVSMLLPLCFLLKILN